jgi:hypothetical protein
MKREKPKVDNKLIPSSDLEAQPGPMKFPALRAFMRSYLHQDFGEEYGSVEEAVKTFCDDATEAEVSAVSVEWRAFLEMTRGKPLGEINNSLASKLGSSWNATSVGELSEITEALDDCAAEQS